MDGQKKKRWGDIIIDKRCTYKEIFQKHMRQKKAYMYMRPRTSSHHTLREGTRSRGHSSLSFLVAAICAHMLVLECIGSCASAQINCSASHPAACANPLKLLPLPTPRCRFPQGSGQAPVAPHHLYSCHMCYLPPSNTYLASKKKQSKTVHPWTALVPNRKDRERSRGSNPSPLFCFAGLSKEPSTRHLPRPRSRSGMMKF